MTTATTSFYMDTGTMNTLYKGTETYYYVSHTPKSDTPNNGFIRLIFGGGIQLGQNSYCQSSDLTPFIP